jgi:hypothetical protein
MFNLPFNEDESLTNTNFQVNPRKKQRNEPVVPIAPESFVPEADFNMNNNQNPPKINVNISLPKGFPM